MRRIIAACLALLVLAGLPATALASLGVGVGTGRIEVSEPLKSGGIYTLPPITVFNTGTQAATYAMAVTLNESQPQLKPDPKWFSFTPASFRLEPGKSQTVTPVFNAPIRTQPGDYFAYLEARPDRTVEQGTAAVGVAAATKLSFEVVPSNLFYAILYRLLALYRQFMPWSQIATAAVAITGAVLLARRRLRFDIKISKIKPQ